MPMEPAGVDKGNPGSPAVSGGGMLGPRPLPQGTSLGLVGAETRGSRPALAQLGGDWMRGHWSGSRLSLGLLLVHL